MGKSRHSSRLSYVGASLVLLVLMGLVWSVIWLLNLQGIWLLVDLLAGAVLGLMAFWALEAAARGRNFATAMGRDVEGGIITLLVNLFLHR